MGARIRLGPGIPQETTFWLGFKLQQSVSYGALQALPLSRSRGLKSEPSGGLISGIRVYTHATAW